MYDFNQPVLSDYNPYIKGGKRRLRKTRRHKKSRRSRRTRRRYR